MVVVGPEALWQIYHGSTMAIGMGAYVTPGAAAYPAGATLQVEAPSHVS
jgi:hypothetical protein